MATLEERVAYLEGRGEDHAGAMGELRMDMRDLRGEMRGLRGEMSDLRGEMSDLRSEMSDLRTEMNRRFDNVESKFDSKFTWLSGFQFATLMAVIAALLNARFR